MTKNKKIAVALVGVLTVSMITGSFAYYNATHTVDNVMSTLEYGDILTEVFTPKEDWEPGEKADKMVGVTNTGDYDIVVRIKMDETWMFDENTALTIGSDNGEFNATSVDASKQDDADDGLTADDGSVVYKELASTGWTYNQSDGYWYYNQVLAAGSETGALLSSITLCEDTDMGLYDETVFYIVTGSTDTPAETAAWTTEKPTTELEANQYLHVKSVSALTEGCEGYAGADYKLTITAETCQATEDAILATFAADGSATADSAPANTVTWWPTAE